MNDIQLINKETKSIEIKTIRNLVQVDLFNTKFNNKFYGFKKKILKYIFLVFYDNRR